MTPGTSPRDRAELARVALACATEASALVARGYRSHPAADKKGRTDLVTSYDFASQDLLLRRLDEATPGIAVVAEEGDAGDRPGDARGGLVWYVDPLDGTTNFVHGHPFWCVAVGLADAGQPVAGAVVAPPLGVQWTAWMGDGEPGVACRNDVPCRVSSTDRIEDALLATGFPAVRDRAPDDNFDSFVRVKRAARGVRRCGSAAMDLCFVADGTYDGYWERKLHAWDIVAGAAVVLAAGGRLTSLEGGEPRYEIGHVVATNGLVHDALMGLVQGDPPAR